MTVTRLARPEAANPFERWMTCNSCGNRRLVCGKVSDLVDGEYRCFRCRWPAGLWVSAQVRRAPDGKEGR